MKVIQLPPHMSLMDNGLRLLFLICFKILHNCILPYYHNYCSFFYVCIQVHCV